MTDSDKDQILEQVQSAVEAKPPGHEMFVITTPKGIELSQVIDKLPIVLPSMLALGFAFTIIPDEDGSFRGGFYLVTEEMSGVFKASENKAELEFGSDFIDKALSAGNPEVARYAGLKLLQQLAEMGMTALEGVVNEPDDDDDEQ